MNIIEAINQLESLKEDAISHFDIDGTDGIFRADAEALEIAIAALMKQKKSTKNINDNFSWISVKDRIPNDQEEVLVCTRSKNGCRNIDKGYWSIDRFIHRGSAQVTHWMPLPDFPKD